ncbi:hypothetical protein OsJ_34233 [Oryza sativa Japonica Group]|uniref:NB-ARC domain-containing protein n=1 Tax=Oryza sativa subsp. japonica TaxID=39947 RepID=A3CC97_ORYSJ|nr:hypothetical protein OsJ_34233 [Oryza sativa Japonica Group]
MEAALLDVSEAPIDQPPNNQVKLWARNVRELSYNIEDSIDKFMVRIDTHAAPHKLHSFRDFIDRSLDLLTKAKIRHSIGTDIKDIKSRIKEISERRDRYKVDNVVTVPFSPTVDSLRLSALYKKMTELVGIEEKSDELVKMLMEGDKQELKIVSIVGFGGLGKTTLAKVVYEKLKVQFACGFFVTMSLNPNMEKIFSNMLCQLDKEKYSHVTKASWGEAQLINEIREFLQNKRYFIVIDDIWSNVVWETIKYTFLGNECGSKIITTTQILDVAKEVGGVYQLKPLSPAVSRKLFYQKIFGAEGRCPVQLAVVSEGILKKCGGVPLAIITIASLLASKNDRDNILEYWSKVYHSIGSGLEDNLHVNNMRKILSVSYYNLPPHLRACLLYLSCYPEDTNIGNKDVIWKWICEGFVRAEHMKTLHVVGMEYLNELWNKSLIQPISNCDNMPWDYCLHDMVLDLITFLSNEEQFMTSLGDQQPMLVPHKIRRLSLQSIKQEYFKLISNADLSHVRSLIVSKQAFSLLPNLSSFPVLRVLDLSGCDQVDNRHCRDICNTLHLRYLNLHRTSISEIPEEIGNLQFLLVLDITKTRLREVPSTFVQLQQLVDLCVGPGMRLPDDFGNLKTLQSIWPHIYVMSPTMLRNMGGLTKLRHLSIRFHEWDESYQKSFELCLSNLVNLRSITVRVYEGVMDSKCENLSPGPQQLEDIDMNRSVANSVPIWMSSLSFLSSLDIKLKTLGHKDLQILGNMPSLSDLTLWVNEPTQDRHERLVIDNCYPFHCLTFLKLMANNMEVAFAQGPMQKLQKLRFGFGVRKTVDQFGNFDFGLEKISVEHLDVCVNYSDANRWEVNAAEAAIREAVNMNPNNPTLKLTTLFVLL